MDTNDFKFRELLNRYNDGQCTPDEVSWLESWYLDLNEQQKVLPSESELETISQEIRAEVQLRIRTKVASILHWRKLTAAAALVIVFFTILFYSVGIWNTQKNSQALAHIDVQPGKRGATLTLADGKKIKLSEVSDGLLENTTGVTITKLSDGKVVYSVNQNHTQLSRINSLSTANGETYEVLLPDGSLVHLNAASTLTYTTTLVTGSERHVKLSGEAYFEIAKDHLHPFIVETAKQNIMVLGTHFNVNAYDDNDFEKTTLLEGSVKISSGNNTVRLRPGEQSSAYLGKIEIVKIDPLFEVAWKDGIFMFNNERLVTIMNQIARWYDVDVVYGDDEVKVETFFGTISRNKTLSKVLEQLSMTKTAKFRLEGKTIYVNSKEANQ